MSFRVAERGDPFEVRPGNEHEKDFVIEVHGFRTTAGFGNNYAEEAAVKRVQLDLDEYEGLVEKMQDARDKALEESQ